MKNKKSIYILLPIVLLIWGIVIFQFFSFSTPIDTVENTSEDFKIEPLKLKERKTFSVNVNYRDPFLGKMYAAQESSKAKKSSNIKKESRPEEVIVWPSIIYKGMISDAKEKKKLFILKISGHDFFMKKGDTENDILLKDGDRESIYVKYKGNLNLIMLAE